MRPILRALALLAAIVSIPAAAQGWTLVIHGGAGVIEREHMTPEREAAVRAALSQALEAGGTVLDGGGSALDAVEAAVRLLEDDPNFNAGRGAVFTYDGTNELDASIMDGRTRAAGAVAGVTATRHPVSLARAVMERSPHVMLAGDGANAFSLEQGLEQADPSWFRTEERFEQLQRLKAREASGGQASAFDIDLKYGTVGAVARDKAGNLAAATSTGGITGKRWGRVGDAPVIGAGTYADNRACAVSATGAGEYFIRVGVAHEICARLRLLQETNFLSLSDKQLEEDEKEALARLAGDAVLEEVADLGGSGGVIVVTSAGYPFWSFNTPGMYRGVAREGAEAEVAIYGDE